MDELKAKNEKEIAALEEQLRIKLFDRSQAENDMKLIDGQVEKVRLAIEESFRATPANNDEDSNHTRKGRAAHKAANVSPAKSRLPIIKSR